MFSNHFPRKFHVLFLIAITLITCLALAAPAFATEPEEADPDPDGLSTGDSTVRVITVSDLAELDPNRLEPGRYLVRVVDAEGPRSVHEIVVRH